MEGKATVKLRMSSLPSFVACRLQQRLESGERSRTKMPLINIWQLENNSGKFKLVLLKISLLKRPKHTDIPYHINTNVKSSKYATYRIVKFHLWNHVFNTKTKIKTRQDKPSKTPPNSDICKNIKNTLLLFCVGVCLPCVSSVELSNSPILLCNYPIALKPSFYLGWTFRRGGRHLRDLPGADLDWWIWRRE